MRQVTPFVGRYPSGFANWLTAMDFALAPVVEVAIVGGPASPEVAALLAPLVVAGMGERSGRAGVEDGHVLVELRDELLRLVIAAEIEAIEG